MAEHGSSEAVPQSQGSHSSGGSVTFNLTYLQSPKGILKILEIFCLMIAFACAADVCSRYCQNAYGGRYSFFLFATIMPWILCIIIFVLFLFCLTEMVKINWKLTVLVNSAIWAIVLLIAASLWADIIDSWRKVSGASVDGRFYASIVFAFFAIIAFIVDIVVHIKFD